MNVLFDAAAMLVLAAGLVLLVLLGLRLAAPAVLRRDEPERPRPRRLEAAAVAVAFLLAALAAAAVQTAYGAPMGERSSPAVEVLSTGDCTRPVAGLGLVVRCEPSGWTSTLPNEYYLSDGEALRVVGGAAVAPGAEVAEYRIPGWRLLLPVHPESQWRDTADESKPDLRWLSALPFAGLFAYAGSMRLRRWVARVRTT
ncbi:hypothetical protein AB0A73_25945 [Glycomyces sp. NPDC047369]